MRVSDIAQEYKIPVDGVLNILKTLKLKAIDGKQELNTVVVSVLRNELAKQARAQQSAPKEVKVEKPAPKPAEKLDHAEKPEKSTKVEKIEKVETKTPLQKEKLKIPPSVKEEKKVETLTEKEKPSVVGKKVALKKKTIAAKKVENEPPPPPQKVKKKLIDAPVVTLKPLAKKRRKTSRDEQSSSPVPNIFGDKPAGTSLQESSSGAQGASSVQEQIPEKPLVDLELQIPISVKDLSSKIQQKPNVILGQLMKMGILANINQALDKGIAEKIVKTFGFNLVKAKTQEDQIIEEHENLEIDQGALSPRSPVVTFMGHVDHGKTSLLDKIRKTKVADREHGGITQHMGAYSVTIPKGRITFLDTPGHEAFTAMRARGAHITDIVVLVIAADEGIMPQTDEAIDHARAAGVPIVVALNKIDRPNINPDRVKKQLAERNLNPEDWGGKTVVIGVSAVTGEGIDTLLEMILLESELLELKANYEKMAAGIVVEAHMSQGRGAMATMIVQSGRLKEGDVIIVGANYGKVKAMFDDHKKSLKEAGPSTPVEVLGLPNVPEAGERFYVVADERTAREITLRKQEQLKSEKYRTTSKLSLEDVYAKIQEGSIKELNVVIKADVQGSLGALQDSLEKIPNDKVKLHFIHTGMGEVNASDILLAYASNAIIIAFHVGIDVKAKKELEKQPVDVREYRIIYDAVDDIKKALEGLLEPKLKKRFVSRIEVRQVFNLSRSGIVAGCYVTKGKVHRKIKADIIRNSEIIFSGSISSLKRFKDDVREVNEGMECGVVLDGFDKYEPGDIIEAYEVDAIAQRL